jgi:hypothetical protein
MLYLLRNCFTHFLTFGDQIFVVYHSISSVVCIVVGSSIFWSFQIRVVTLLNTQISVLLSESFLSVLVLTSLRFLL